MWLWQKRFLALCQNVSNTLASTSGQSGPVGDVKKRWNLTEQSFYALLDFLDPDRARAAVHYETVRAKLTRLFEWRGCIPVRL